MFKGIISFIFNNTKCFRIEYWTRGRWRNQQFQMKIKPRCSYQNLRAQIQAKYRSLGSLGPVSLSLPHLYKHYVATGAADQMAFLRLFYFSLLFSSWLSFISFPYLPPFFVSFPCWNLCPNKNGLYRKLQMQK